jgi:glycosyltransferase involved in cell wall biosynthesis
MELFMISTPLRYLLVTHIPFSRIAGGSVMLDALWARDLEGLAESLGPIRVVAPEIPWTQSNSREAPSLVGFTWGATSVVVKPDSGLTFQGFPQIASRRDGWRWPFIRSVLRREVTWADVVHSSNLFPPYVGLSYAHDEAMRQGKKTIFVIAEDFYDMLEWEWVRLAQGRWARWRRQRVLQALDARVRSSAATASLTFLHTPAAVARYRLSARNSVAIRQPEHEADDVISREALTEKCTAVVNGDPLTIIAACRHKPLKGLDFLIRAIAVLATRGVKVRARLFGNGEMTGQLQAEVMRLGLAEMVSFPGTLPPGVEIIRAIAEGHIFAMPHRTTDFGRAFFDAMAGGTPVVAFRTAASVETVRDGVDGILAPLDDVEGLAAVIERFHRDREFLVRAAEAARTRALVDTRSAWHHFRAVHIRALMNASSAATEARYQPRSPILVGQA